MNATIVVGLGWGDEGKGSIVDALTRKTGADLVVRFCGGAQAAHHVVTDEGLDHCFAQFGSGTLAGARTHLSRFMLIDPAALINEAEHLREITSSNPFDRLTIDPDAPLITPYHRALNRLRELARGDARHGSCGMGVGELASDIVHERAYLTASDVYACPTYMNAFVLGRRTQEYCESEVESLTLPDTPEVEHNRAIIRLPLSSWFERIRSIADDIHLSLIPPSEHLIFEGAQGVLLDEWHGFHPHTTWSTCTYENVFTLIKDQGLNHDIHTIGVTRAYATRHGAGPFPTEDARIAPVATEHNGHGAWQGAFRCGHLDFVMLKYALDVLGGVDQLAVTCLDHWVPRLAAEVYTVGLAKISKFDVHRDHDLVRQERRGQLLERVSPILKPIVDLIPLCEEVLGTPVGITSYGPTASKKEFR